MDGRIGHLHCDYRILGNPTAADVLVTRLQRLVCEQLAAHYAAALDQALGNDPAVYVLRQVDFGITLLVTDHMTDLQLAEQWGARMAGVVMRRIAAVSVGTINGGHNAADVAPLVVRFADQADYVAHFLADLLHGTAWDYWFYGAFADLRGYDLPVVVRTILGKYTDFLPAILGYLQHYGVLTTLLPRLDSQTQHWLWSRVRGDPDIEQAAFQSLLAVAVRLIDQLALWAGPQPTMQALLRAYLATKPSPSDWRDRSGLAVAVLTILRFLATHGYLRSPWAVTDETLPDPSNQRIAVLTLLWTATTRLIEQRNLWAGGRQPDRDVLLPIYLTTDPTVPDWHNQHAMRVAVLNILSFLAARGYLQFSCAPLTDFDGKAWSIDEIQAANLEAWWQQYGSEMATDLAKQLASRTPNQTIFVPSQIATQRYQAFLARLHPVLAQLDWLDTVWLQTAFAEMLAQIYPPDQAQRQALDQWSALQQGNVVGVPKRPGGVASSGYADPLSTTLPLRPMGRGPTPRQREFLENLLVVLCSSGLGLDHRQPTAPANALQLYAILVERFPGWAGDPLASELIQQLLAAWAWVMQTRSPREIVHYLANRNLAAALHALPATDRTAATTTFQLLIDLGPAALAVVETFTTSDNITTEYAGTGTETPCIGIALLFRALLDTRLVGVVERINYPAQKTSASARLQSMLLALYLRWAGTAGVIEGQIDPGLLVLAGQISGATRDETAWSLATLRAAWSGITLADQVRFQAAWLQTLAAQRLLAGTTLHLYLVTLTSGETALVGADETASLWPLGRVVTAPDVMDLMAEWLAHWAEASGHHPSTIIVDDILAPLTLRWNEVIVGSQAGDEVAANHAAGRERLLTALAALDAGQLGMAQTDLTVALTALSLVRLWARWLRQFADSSVPYLLANFVRRPGQIYSFTNGLLVELEPRPLDMVIDMAGYLAELETVPWLEQQRVHFRLRGA